MRRNLRRKAASCALAVMLCASVVGLPAPALAKESLAGGPDIYPAYVANDHTPIRIHLSTDPDSGLAPSSQYYAKVRFTVGESPSGSTNRGWTWNAAKDLWVQERDNKPDWSKFPIVHTDALGRVTIADSWIVAKFGDESTSGDFHLMVSLSSVATSSLTYNSTTSPIVHIFDPRTGGGWIHNGIATGVAPASGALVTESASGDVVGLYIAEAQGVDDDANGIVDDEDYGPFGATGDFRIGVPAATAVGIAFGGSPWVPGTAVVTGPADTDIAIGALDHTAPSAPGAVTALVGDARATISWAAAADDTAVTGYRLYRWLPQSIGSTGYSPLHTLIATLPAGVRSFADTGLINGESYLYEVRAVDAATNAGPRSTTATATPAVSVPTASVFPLDPDGENAWYRTTPSVTLTPRSPERSVQYSFESSPTQWTTYTAGESIPVPDGRNVLSYRETDGTLLSATATLPLNVDTVAPVASLTVPAFCVPAGSAALTFPVRWSAVETGSGGLTYCVSKRTGATGAWDTWWRSSTPQTSAVVEGSGGATYYFQVVAIDAAGNIGPAVASTGTAVPYDQASKAKYSSGWATAKRSSAYRGSVKYTTRSGASASFTLSKGVLYLVTTTGPKYGKLKVTYRGRSTTIDTYSKTTKYRQVIRIATFVPGTAASAVRITNLATRNRSRIEIDGFALAW